MSVLRVESARVVCEKATAGQIEKGMEQDAPSTTIARLIEATVAQQNVKGEKIKDILEATKGSRFSKEVSDLKSDKRSWKQQVAEQGQPAERIK